MLRLNWEISVMTLLTPDLILKEEPLEVVLALSRNCGQRLEAAKTKLE